MKLHALTNLMNDHGTKPRVKVYKSTDMGALLIYEGHPDAADDEIKQLKANSFTVLGKGLLEIHCS